jgi:hypothetical protein
LLRRLTEIEPRNELAWLWLGPVVRTDDERATCLEDLLAIEHGDESTDKRAATSTAPLSRPNADKQLYDPGAPFGLSELVPGGATPRMFESVNPERAMTLDEALEEMRSLRENPARLNEDWLGFINDHEQVVQFAAVDFEGDCCHLDIPLTIGEDCRLPSARPPVSRRHCRLSGRSTLEYRPDQ